MAAVESLICTKPPPRRAARPVHAGSTALPVGPLVVPLAPALHPEPAVPVVPVMGTAKTVPREHLDPAVTPLRAACGPTFAACRWRASGHAGVSQPQGLWVMEKCPPRPLPAAAASFPPFPCSSDALMGTSVSTCTPSPSLAAPLTQPGPFPGWGWVPAGCQLTPGCPRSHGRFGGAGFELGVTSARRVSLRDCRGAVAGARGPPRSPEGWGAAGRGGHRFVPVPVPRESRPSHPASGRGGFPASPTGAGSCPSVLLPTLSLGSGGSSRPRPSPGYL